MKYVILTWFKDWELIKEIDHLEYAKNAYSDAYLVTDDNEKLILFDSDQDALEFAKRECENFKIVDFHHYITRNELI